MQGQRRPTDAALGESLKQAGSEMEARCRRRYCSLGAGEDCLVIGAVARVAAARALDIGRQRHRAVASQRLAKCLASEVEAQGYVALGMLFDDIGEEIPGEDDAVAHPQPP